MKVNELEKLANHANLSFRKSLKALILKVPTPILNTAKGLVAQQSTVDYTGLINGGTSIAFDAKECQSKTSFPLQNIHQHQLLYLQLVRQLGGLAFFLIWFKALHTKAYVVPLSVVEHYWNGDGRKSIPIADFKDEWLTDIDTYIDKVIEMKDVLIQQSP
jgi:recombination protein U